MADTATPPTSAELQASLDRTDLGHWLYVNRTPFLASALVVFVATSGWLWWKQHQKNVLLEGSAAIHRFEGAVLTPFREGKLPADQMVAKFNALDAKAKSTVAVIPVALESARLLEEKGQKAEALALLKQVADAIPPKSSGYLFIAFNYAAAAEDAGQIDEAIRVLEAYEKAGHKVFAVKASLDLGRLYLAKGRQDDAKKRFEAIVKDHPNDELAKIARLYQQRLASAP